MATGFEERPIANENLISIDNLRTEINKSALDTRQDYATNEKNFSVGLYDIDESLQYYFDNVLKPTVVENGETIPVRTIYGNPERWEAMERDGMYRDDKSKIILPLIMYRKTSITRWEQLYWPRLDQLYFVSKRKWSKKKMYSDFELKAEKQGADIDTANYSLTSIPNYVVITYEGVLWTSFLEHTNSIMEKVIFSEGTYWGDPKKFKFRSEVDGFDTAVDVSSDTQRMVRINFSITCYGYILPEQFNEKLTSQISFAPKRVVFGTEIIGE